MLRFETAGESHGECLVATLTGLPAGVPVSLTDIDRELWRRQQGYGRGGRMKIETDKAHIVSGVRHSQTIGSPIAILMENTEQFVVFANAAVRAGLYFCCISTQLAADEAAYILRDSGAAADHPVHPHLPESAYLKAQLLQLD